MARRRHRGDDLRVSFFSFQDIITCLTGIFIFISLLLVLSVTATGANSNAVRPAPVGAASSSDVTSLEREQQRLAAEAADVAAKVQRQGTREGPASLATRLAEIEARLARARDAQQNVTRERREMESRLEALRRRQDEVEREIESKQARHDELRRRRRTVVTLPGNDDGKPWVVVQLSAADVRVAPIESIDRAAIFRDAAPDARVGGLLAEMRQYPRAGVNVLVLVKASAFDFGPATIERLKAMGFTNIGFEPLREDAQVLLESG